MIKQLLYGKYQEGNWKIKIRKIRQEKQDINKIITNNKKIYIKKYYIFYVK